MVTYFLMLGSLLTLGDVPPEVLAPHKTKDACLVQADKVNHLRKEEQKRKGIAAFCVKIVAY